MYWLEIGFQISRIREQGYPADSRCQRLPHGCDGSQASGPWARGECSDRSADPSSKENLCSHDDETFDAQLLHHTIHINQLLSLSGVCLIAICRNVRHALAGRIGPPAETVRYGVVLSWT